MLNWFTIRRREADWERKLKIATALGISLIVLAVVLPFIPNVNRMLAVYVIATAMSLVVPIWTWRMGYPTMILGGLAMVTCIWLASLFITIILWLAGVTPYPLAFWGGLGLSCFGNILIALLTALVVRWHPPHRMHCPKCGYDLGGVNEPRCPECGHHFTQQEFIRQLAD